MTGAETRIGVLCLGASAGGLRSLEAVLSRLPASFPWPVLVSQHLQPEHVSLIPAILARATKLAVREAVDGERPVPGVVYTCPSSAELGFSPDGRLTLRPPVAGRPQRIDHLFSTASFARPGLVIAVILSGTGSDGTAGSLVVKLNGGTVIAESGESAQWSAMPQAAVKAGTVDATRTAEAIAPLLIDLAEGGLEDVTQAMDRDVREIARTISASSGTDFTRYRPATLRRRIERRRALAGAATVRDYHDIVKRDENERGELTKSLLLPVTEFFRDPPAWDALASEVLPALVDRARSGSPINVWCAGCASGEEAYSMAILLAERGAPLENVRIVGTDLDAESIRRATSGIYDAARMRHVDAGRRARFFREEKDGSRVIADLRRVTGFRVHDLTRDPPPGGPFDIVACRNVLIYFDDSLQAQVLASFGASLAASGVVLLGRSEAVPADAFALAQVPRTVRVFSYRNTTHSEPAPRAVAVRSPRTGGAHGAGSDPAGSRVDAVVVEDSRASILVVDGSWRIAEANRRARDATSASVVGKDLFDVFPGWRGSPVQDALRAVMATGRSVQIHGVPMSPGYVDLTIEVLSEGGGRRLFLVADAVTADPASSRRDRESPMPVDDEVAVVRDKLRTTSEELAAANAELQASNEELQATNEELASLNEEFLSTNQNLASTNEELQANADDARPGADLLHAILASRGDAIVACDSARNVTLVTPKAADLLALDARALGKRLVGRMIGVADATLDEWIDAASSPKARIRREVSTRNGTLRVVVESLLGADGARVGWSLTWAVPRAAPRSRHGDP
ncbi:MAG TPA: CheR family methyltransferase [Candidatus Thermoplasmatota archaeon]|nr:CheR family methyltransferase [Candidatus Thermoplasmatota archaeon]